MSMGVLVLIAGNRYNTFIKYTYMVRFRIFLLFSIKICIKIFQKNSDRLPEDGGRRSKSDPGLLESSARSDPLWLSACET